MKHACLRCGHKWTSIKEKPVVCPRCKSYKYDKPKEKPSKAKKEARQ